MTPWPAGRWREPPARAVASAAVLLAVVAAACRPADPGARELDALLEVSVRDAATQYTEMDEVLPDSLFPRTLNADGTLRTNDSRWWTSGFFPGSLWILHEITGDPDLRERALARTWTVEPEARNAADHDIGFKVFNSFGRALAVTGDSAELVPVILTAARTLASRFDPRVGAIRSWGRHPDDERPYLVIVDNMMNLELLFWAAEHGEPELFDVAVSHADRTLENHFRPDGSSYHVLEYDPVTGEVLRKRTAQGAGDESAWSRGQAWGLYGYTMTYRETGYDRYLDRAVAIADFMLNHPNMPDDGVPYWDFDAPGIPDTYRDASAAAITASALLELATWVPDALRAEYLSYARRTLATLSRRPYRAAPGENGNFLLMHGVGSLPENSEVDVPLSYADYYYLEAIQRLRALEAGERPVARVVDLGEGWARSSVNVPIFRHHGLTTHKRIQYAAWYDPEGRLVLARRAVGDDAWETRVTEHSGDVADAHHAISLGVDGSGVLHVAWDLHDDTLRYARSVAPGSLELTGLPPMIGRNERRMTYPQFYPLPGGDLLFLYRAGASGRGDVMLNRYSTAEEAWVPVHHPLISGQGVRNAYPNLLALEDDGTVHLSWTWRETWDVATNHDVLYAVSLDGGATWRRSDGQPYALPITADDAETAARIPRGRSLINQTTMAVDGLGRPLVATYWRDEDSRVPQYRLVWHDGSEWRISTVGHRTRPFDLAGGGTRRIPMSRPLVLTRDSAVYVVFRDFERGGHLPGGHQRPGPGRVGGGGAVRPPVGLWKPMHDPEVWLRGALHLLVQHVGQGQGETLEDIPPQPVRVLEWGAGLRRLQLSPGQGGAGG